MTGEFPAQRGKNAENISIWWRHYDSDTIPSLGLWSFIYIFKSGKKLILWYRVNLMLKNCHIHSCIPIVPFLDLKQVIFRIINSWQSRIFRNTCYFPVSVMAKMVSFRFLLSVLIRVNLPRGPLAAGCSLIRSACFYQNTRGLSSKIESINYQDIFPLSCVSFCAMKESCLGVNEIIDSGICQILEEDDIIIGLEWYEMQGYNLWSFENPCPKVQFSLLL